MRLTLRTLLAYLDDTLEAPQAREIGEKIAESGMAQSLVNRIREVMRRRRLMAPDVDGPGMGIDPNLVSEYIDSTLAPDDVADIEKVCLESDIHLAEVAACHQILAIVQCEPVEIVPRSRERMYALGPLGRPKPAAVAAAVPPSVAPAAGNGAPVGTAPAAAAAAQPAPAAASSFNDRIPDYLRPKPFWQRMLPVGVFAIMAAVFLALLSTDPTFRSFFSRDADPGGTNGTPGDPIAQNGAAPTNEAAAAATVPRPAPPAATTPQTPAAAPGANPAATPGEPAPATTVEAPPAVPQTPLPAATDKPADAPPTAEPARPDDAKPENAVPPPPVPAAPAAPVEYVSVEGVLLRFDLQPDPRDPALTGWMLLPRRSITRPGEKIAAPEPFDATLDVARDQCRATVVGGSVVTVLGASETALFGFAVHSGRLLLQTKPANEGDPPAADVVLALQIGGQTWQLAIPGAGATCGVEVALRDPEGFEQDLGENTWTGRIVAAAGAASLTDAAGRVHRLDPKTALTLSPPVDGAEYAVVPAEVPRWMETAPPKPFTRRYATLFEKTFNPKLPAEQTLPAVVNDPSFQLSEMAVKGLVLTENAGALVKTLASSRNEHEESRIAAIAGLRAWLGQAPGRGEILKAELAKHFVRNEERDDVKDLYELLWGYAEADARDPDVSARLVAWLDHPERAVRELAFYHIHRLTGLRYDYRPQLPQAQRSLAYGRWKTHLAKEGALLKK